MCHGYGNASHRVTAGNVHLSAQTLMGAWLITAIPLEARVTPIASSNRTSNGARIGMPVILLIAGHTMRSVSRTPSEDKARKLEVREL